MLRSGITFLLMLALGTGLSMGQTPTASASEVSCVGISHVGEQDKFMMPIVIAADSRSESACRRIVNGNPRMDLAQFIRVSRRELTAISDHIHEFVNRSSGQRRCYAFGTFGWIVIRNGQKTEAQTCPEGSVKLLSDLLGSSTHADLNHALRDSLAYLGAKN
jgi:hypothetical protein